LARIGEFHGKVDIRFPEGLSRLIESSNPLHKQ